MTLKRFKRPLKYDVCDPDIHPLYGELNRDVTGNVKSSRSNFLHKILMCGASLIAMILGIYLIETFESMAAGNTMLKGSSNGTISMSSAIQSIYDPDDSNSSSGDPSIPILHHATPFNQPKRILALGGSNTWGENLENTGNTFPLLLAQRLGVHWDAVNIGLKATDSSYASQCVESLVREASHSIDDMVKDYDIILLEYSFSGLDNFHLLARRLRRRYPNAVILYVQLWSLRMTIENTETGLKPASLLVNHSYDEAVGLMSTMIQDPNISWKYSDEMVAYSKKHSHAAADAIQQVGGKVFELPMPGSPQEAILSGWFSSDYHHLSKHGHDYVAHEIYKLLNQGALDAQTISVQRDHTWGKGDQCYSWYNNGQTPFVSFQGGTMTKFGEPNNWALQIGADFGHPATIFFENTKEEQQPVRLEVMSWGPDAYPTAKVQVNAPDQRLDDSAIVLDPLHPVEFQRSFHVSRSVHIGWVEPGKNSITIDSVETKEHPFRVTGIIMCGACDEMDNVYSSMQFQPVPKADFVSDGIVANAIGKEQEVQLKPPQDPQQVSLEAFMPLEGSSSLHLNPGDAFGQATPVQDGKDQTIAHLQNVQAQNIVIAARDAPVLAGAEATPPAPDVHDQDGQVQSLVQLSQPIIVPVTTVPRAETTPNKVQNNGQAGQEEAASQVQDPQHFPPADATAVSTYATNGEASGSSALSVAQIQESQPQPPAGVTPPVSEADASFGAKDVVQMPDPQPQQPPDVMPAVSETGGALAISVDVAPAASEAAEALGAQEANADVTPAVSEATVALGAQGANVEVTPTVSEATVALGAQEADVDAAPAVPAAAMALGGQGAAFEGFPVVAQDPPFEVPVNATPVAAEIALVPVNGETAAAESSRIRRRKV